MMIYAEERNFNDSFAAAMKLEEPMLPLPEEFEDKQEYEKAYGKYQDNYQKFINKRDNEMRAKLDAGEIPPGVTGLVPDGASKVSWRWMGEVFEESTEDLLNNSIVVRNLQELGVDSIEALKYLFPGKTDEERAAMLSGFPFRMVQQTQQSISSFINLLGQFYQLPHPQMPDVPLASDPNLDMTGFLYRSLEFLRKELSYSGSYKPASTSSIPDELSSADQLRAERGQPVRDEPVPNLPGINGSANGGSSGTGLPGIGPGPAGFGSNSGQSMAAGVSGAQRKPEYVQPLPGPGFTLGLPDNTNAAGNYSTQLGFNGPTGSADFAAPSFNPELYGIRRQQPGAASGAARSQSGSGSVPKRNQRRKS
jgi:hypothetical protein